MCKIEDDILYVSLGVHGTQLCKQVQGPCGAKEIRYAACKAARSV